MQHALSLCVRTLHHTPSAQSTWKQSYIQPLKLSRTHPFNPFDIAPDRRQIFVSVFRDHNDVLNPHATHALVTLKHFMVDVLRVAHGCQEVWREIAPWLDSLSETDNVQMYSPKQANWEARTTTIPASSGSRNLRYV